jgi:hypothetical protein
LLLIPIGKQQRNAISAKTSKGNAQEIPIPQNLQSKFYQSKEMPSLAQGEGSSSSIFRPFSIPSQRYISKGHFNNKGFN